MRRAFERLGLISALILGACAPSQPGEEVLVRIQDGATFRQVVDTLVAREVVRRPLLFRAYARFQGLDRSVRAGTYRLSQGAAFSIIMRDLTEGRVETYPHTVPEGLTLPNVAARLTEATGRDSADIAEALAGDSLHLEWEVPGPGLEGYLFPDTYRFAEGVTLEDVVSAMVARYRSYWTPERREQLDRSGLTEREAVTLASIIQAEARQVSEMPTISSVYHNRLRIGMLLQADPTVLFALGGPRPRLLYAAIDSVADNPYNTYTQSGLPPGPICAPGADAIDAALAPLETDYLYFVARPNGSHIFTRSLAEHNRARIQVRREARGGSE